MNRKTHILGFAGSLRKGSYNRAMLRAAVESCADDVELEVFELDGIPLFSEDLEQKPPEKVRLFKERIRAADAILIATPEYNYSIPGVLKNAIDWASRPYGDGAFDGKAAAIMGASLGPSGTARAQYHLRQCCVFLNMYLLNQPEVMVPLASEKFDAGGKLTDATVRERIVQLLEHLAEWSRRIQPPAPATATRG
jgi:chromate reductase